MNTITTIENEIRNIISNFKHITFEKLEKGYVGTLVDLDGNELVRGYGNTTIEAINDLHSNLL